MERINRIEFRHVLPEVFVNDELTATHHSDVWLCECRFIRPARYTVEAASGTGKSSMCSFIFGNRSDYTGTILFNSIDIRSFSVGEWCELRRRHLALLPQEMRLFPELTVRENIMLKNRLTDFRSESDIHGLLAEFEIDHKYDVPARLLSIGQQQRVAIVRAICQPFDFILLDEPVSHLDAANNAIAARMVMKAAHEQQAAVISTSVGNPLLIDNGVGESENLSVIKL